MIRTIALIVTIACTSAANADEVSIQSVGEEMTVQVKPADEGKGFSVFSETLKGGQPGTLCVPVTLTCGDGTTASACCPTASYTTYCPKARIQCD